MTSKERAQLRSRLKKMCRDPALRTLYKEFYAWMGQPELLKPAGRGRIEFADAFPLIYLKLHLKGSVSAHRRDVQHLVIDEMQDYTPVQYAVLGKVCPCDKTILGDENQAINAHSSSTAEMIERVFPQAESVRLCTSYRSSYEITQFAQGIAKSSELKAVERHGPLPLVVACASREAEVDWIQGAIESFSETAHRTMAVICKTQPQAEALLTALGEPGPTVTLLRPESAALEEGIVLCSTHLAKGLESTGSSSPASPTKTTRRSSTATCCMWPAPERCTG